MYFMRGGQGGNNSWMWFKMIQQQYLDFEVDGWYNPPQESDKLALSAMGGVWLRADYKEGGQIIQFTPESVEIDQKCTLTL